MATGFIYTVTTLTKAYAQKYFHNVPTYFGGRLYFGPCKRAMRPKIVPGDYIFGISPSNIGPRLIVFISHVKERISFREAYGRFPELRGPNGPIHVEPANCSGAVFPRCSYAHIQGAMHRDEWGKDLSSIELDAFFVSSPQNELVGRWLGAEGPKVNNAILEFLKTCSVHGNAGELNQKNKDATLEKPIAHGKLYTGLHLETTRPEILVNLCKTVGNHLSAQLEACPAPSRHFLLKKSDGSRKRIS